MKPEVPLPPPPRVRHRSPADASLFSSSGPKRSLEQTYLQSRYDDRSSLPSSDPAFFSSDDLPASGLENYNAAVPTGHSRKRRYQGTWWGEMIVNPKRKRGELKEKRHVDSGVWMGSDDSLLPSEDAPLLPNFWRDIENDSGVLLNDAIGKSIQELDHGAHTLARPILSRVDEESREHRFARAIVCACLDTGQDSVDLSNCSLRSIPPELLRPLQHLTKLPAIRDVPVTEAVFGSLQPFLRVFLSSNLLKEFPSDLFELGALKVLSLRANELTDIPTAVRKLTMLQEVNFSVNKLQYLPWELLWLIRKGDLKHLIVRPNPLSKIEKAAIAKWHYLADGACGPHSKGPFFLFNYEGPAPEEAWAPIHIADSPVTRFNMEGLPANELQQSYNNQRQPQPKTLSRVLSLRELCLLSFSQSPYFDHIDETDTHAFPELMARLLRQAKDVRLAGGRRCSVCHRGFVMPRTEWIEWWDCTTYENGLKQPRRPGELLRPLPFRRLGCSWACVPGTDIDRAEGVTAQTNSKRQDL